MKTMFSIILILQTHYRFKIFRKRTNIADVVAK